MFKSHLTLEVALVHLRNSRRKSPPNWQLLRQTEIAAVPKAAELLDFGSPKLEAREGDKAYDFGILPSDKLM